MPRPSLYIATPCFDGTVTVEYLHSLLATKSLFANNPNSDGTLYEAHARGSIWRARDVFLAHFLASWCSHFLSVDSDVSWKAEDIVTLINANVELVSGIYRKRVDKYVLPYEITDEQKGELKVALSIPGGYFLLRRDGARRIWNAFYREPFIYEEDGVECVAVHSPILISGRGSISEDIAFSARFRDAGGTIYVHPKVVANHVGRKTFVTEPLA